MAKPDADTLVQGAILAAMSGVFEALGRALLCLDNELRIVHVSEGLDNLVGQGVGKAVLGKPVQDVLGEELFGPHGTLRRALQGDGRREGWGATLRAGPDGGKQVSITVASLRDWHSKGCDPRVAYVVVVRPEGEETETSASRAVLFSGLVARSVSMRKTFRLIEDLEQSEATVLISGPSGTGKELIARAIHVHSPRRGGGFVAVNCAALPADLLESELFGHVRGAFTGAVQDRVGRFELAEGGTLFLDEVGELPLALQAKLLRVLQERTFERVGESATRSADVRIVAATNRDLPAEVAAGRFREDLYYRLRVLPIEVPPLRERIEDIEPLARHLLTRVSARYNRSLVLGTDALRVLLRHDWPGNVREIENALEFAVAVCKGRTIHADDLPGDLLERSPETRHALSLNKPQSAAQARGGEERKRIIAALEASQWSRSDAARALGVSRSTLWRKMRELGL